MVTKHEKRLVGSRYRFPVTFVDEAGKLRKHWVKAKDANMARIKFMVGRARSGKSASMISVGMAHTKKQFKGAILKAYEFKYGKRAAEKRFDLKPTVDMYGRPLKKKKGLGLI